MAAVNASIMTHLVSRVRASQRLQDRLAAAGVFAIGLFLIMIGITNMMSVFPGVTLAGAGRWWHLIPLAIGCCLLLFKRRFPIMMLIFGWIVFVADAAYGSSLGMILVLFDLMFNVGIYAGLRARRRLTVIVVVAIIALSVTFGLPWEGLPGVVLIGLQLTTMFVVPLWWAANVRQKSELADLATAQVELERARTHDLETLAELARHEAVQEERASMARDLHDVIASHMSSVAIHSGAALARAPEAQLDRDALVTIRHDSLASLQEMRSMILLLRSPTGSGQDRESVSAPARLADLEALLLGYRAAGIRVDVETTDIDHLPAAVDQAAHRIIHEALNNAAKHATRSHVRIKLAVRDRKLDVQVSNGLTGGSAEHPALTAGTGLITMRERAEALGGTFDAGPDDVGGWRVQATIPVEQASADAALATSGGTR